jgi:hypothetical protein
MQREKHIKSGRLFEAEFYPVFADGRRVPTRAPKTKRSTAEQARYNLRKAQKNFVRRVNANFFTGDIYMHPTFEPGVAPFTMEDAKLHIANFFRRAKRMRVKALKEVKKTLKISPEDKRLVKLKKKLDEPFRYAYRIESETFKRGERKGQKRWHFHLFMTGGCSRDDIEECWGLGSCNADRYQPEKYGPERAALYAAKEGQGEMKFGYSKNLVSSDDAKVKDGAISASGVERLAKMRVDDAAFWEKRYKGYKFLRCYSRFNTYNGYWYVSVVMYKPESEGALPRWTGTDDWLCEAE